MELLRRPGGESSYHTLFTQTSFLVFTDPVVLSDYSVYLSIVHIAHHCNLLTYCLHFMDQVYLTVELESSTKTVPGPQVGKYLLDERVTVHSSRNPFVYCRQQEGLMRQRGGTARSSLGSCHCCCDCLTALAPWAAP